MATAIVVGAGIVGATVCKALLRAGHDARTFDTLSFPAGTNASGGHLKPSWFSGVPKEQYTPAMELLSELWGLEESDFRVRPTRKTVKIWRVDTDQILSERLHTNERKKVTEVFYTRDKPCVRTYTPKEGEEEFEPDLLVVCAGAWTAKLVGSRWTGGTDYKKGISFRMKQDLPRPFVKPWAPYKQVVAHQQGDQEIWIGDGTAILSKNWKEGHVIQCRKRCLKAVNLHENAIIREIVGVRGYNKHDKSQPCLFRKLANHTYVVCGAAKNGTIAAGWAAQEIVRAAESL